VPCPIDEESPFTEPGETPKMCCSFSPIVIDVAGDGFRFTDAANGFLAGLTLDAWSRWV
jgi:hypothetical protein